MEINQVEAVQRIVVRQVVSPIVLFFFRLHLICKDVVVEEGRVCVHSPRFSRVISPYRAFVDVRNSSFNRNGVFSFILCPQDEVQQRVAVVRFMSGRVNDEFRNETPIALPPFQLNQFPIGGDDALTVCSSDADIGAQYVSLPFVVGLRVRNMRFARRVFIRNCHPYSIFDEFRFLHFMDVAAFPYVVGRRTCLVDHEHPGHGPNDPQDVLRFSGVPQAGKVRFVEDMFLFYEEAARRYYRHDCSRCYWVVDSRLRLGPFL